MSSDIANREAATGKFMLGQGNTLMFPTKVAKSDSSFVYSIKLIFKVFVDCIETFFWPQLKSKPKICLQCSLYIIT